MKLLNKLFAIAIVAIMAASCGGVATGSKGGTYASANGEAKYIFYFIGDGMAATQVQLAEAALTSDKFRQNYAAQTGTLAPAAELHLKGLSIIGLATSNAQDRYITDSAAAGTALATGSKTGVGIVSQDMEGNALQTVAEKAKAKGMKVGVVSSVSIDHATPACFYSHEASRSNYSNISDQLLTSGFDYFAGGSVKWSSRARAEETDMATAYAIYRERAAQSGFNFVTTKQEFESVGSEKPVIATLDMLANKQYSGDGSALPYTIDLSKQSSEDDKISLAEFTQKGIDLLECEDGFFMMVEGGKIDWACHANDAATVAYEVVAFDAAIGVAMEFAKKHPNETLIVVTGDHDCGGLTLGFAGTGYESSFEILAESTTSYALFTDAAIAKIKAGESFEKLLAFACEQFGFTNLTRGDDSARVEHNMELSDFEVKILRDAYMKSARKVKKVKATDESDIYFSRYGSYDPFTTTCTNILNNKAGITFSSFSHTAVPVMVFADGASSQIFSGYYDNTDIPRKIMQAANL
ncbi:MAG: alkaline phosphatase [Rikenellaceae bacterium]